MMIGILLIGVLLLLLTSAIAGCVVDDGSNSVDY
jgi:hypothetical protein